MLLKLANHFVVDLIHVSVMRIYALKSRSHLLELSIKVVFALLQFSLLSDRIGQICQSTL